MKKGVITKEVVLVAIYCGECGIDFAVPEQWREKRQEDGRHWYCPNGHCRVYKDSDTELLKKERERSAALKADLERSEVARKRAENAAMDAAQEAKRRAKRSQAGVCQECHRTFQNVARHMVAKHHA